MVEMDAAAARWRQRRVGDEKCKFPTSPARGRDIYGATWRREGKFSFPTRGRSHLGRHLVGKGTADPRPRQLTLLLRHDVTTAESADAGCPGMTSLQ